MRFLTLDQPPTLLPHIDEERAQSGARDLHLNPHEDRCWRFKKWHKDTSQYWYSIDGDILEYRLDAQKVWWPVALIELTGTKNYEITEDTRAKVHHRIFERTSQGKLLRRTAELLKIPCFVFLMREDLREIYGINVFRPDLGWKKTSLNSIASWLNSLKA